MRMRILSLCHIIFYPLLCCFLFIVGIGVSCPGYAATTPNREVVVVDTSEKLNKVQWKKLWDEAREFFRQGELVQASKYYKKLLAIKPNIEEAKWEYCKVLVELEDWPQARILLETLLENDPNRIDYLFIAGRVALERANFLQAVKYYGQVYEREPLGELSTPALKGLISGLEGLGKMRNAFLMMEQLYQRDSSDPERIHKLARFSNEFGMTEKARFYYEKLVTQYSVDDETLFQAALLYDSSDDSDESVYYWERYLERKPHYLSFRRNAANHYLKKGDRSRALPHLLVMFEKGEADDDILLLLGRIYLQDEKRPDKALYYLEKYRENYPADIIIKKEIDQIRYVLANDFLSIVENDGAWRLWRDLAKITPNRKAIYLAMADLLERLNREEELLEVLEIVHKHDPEDNSVTIRIAEVYRKKNEYNKSLHFLSQLVGAERHKPAKLHLKADMHFQLGNEKEALRVYLEYLKQVPDDVPIRVTCLKLAGKLGLISELYTAYNRNEVTYSKKNSFSELDKLYLEGLLESGLFSEATMHYDKLLRKVTSTSKAGIEIRLHRVEGLQSNGLIYEAEQIVRQILAENIKVINALEKLTELAIQDQQLSWANSWFYLLLEKVNMTLSAEEYGKLPENIFFLKIKLLDAEGEYKEAVTLLRKYMSEEPPGSKTADGRKRKAHMALVRLHYKYGEYERCRRVVYSFAQKYPLNTELVVISGQLGRIGSKEAFVVSTTHDIDTEKSPTRTLARAAIEYEYEAYDAAMEFVVKVLDNIPSSVRAQLLKAKIYTALGNYSEALAVLKNIYGKFPEEEFFELQALKIEYRRGNFGQIVKKLPLSDSKPDNGSATKKLKLDEDYFFWKRLLLARSLWANKQWGAAIKVYNSLLDTPVKTMYLEKMEVEKVNFHLPPLKRSFWNMITFSHQEQPDPVATIMGPSFVGENIGEPIGHISASLYQKYRWQKLIERELTVRKAMKRRNYYEVEKEYRASLKRGGAKDTLFDLAEVYGRMGLYGKEAELYEKIRAEGPEYPELNKLVRLNKLKRKPRVSVNYRYSSGEGRGGYIDMKKKSGGFEGWIMPTLSQEMNISYFRNDYQSSDGERQVRSNRWFGAYTSNFEDKVDLNMSFGVEDLSDDDDYTILYNIEFLGRIDDIVQGHVSFSQDIVDDTVEAVEERISYQSLGGGVTIDVVPRWFCGIDYRHREYSDDNRQGMLRLWTSYNLYGESNLLRIKYVWENTHNSKDNIGVGNAFTQDFGHYDPPYWSPDTFWHHLLMVHFKHTFSHGSSEEKLLSHYTVDYAFGYESGNNVTQDASFNIFLEMNRHFLLKGNFTFGSATDYNETDLALSLIYRW